MRAVPPPPAGAGSPPRTVVIVVAAYNEERAIGRVVRELRSLAPRVVVVDDGSADATAREAAAAGAVVLRHLLNRGQGAALQTGLAWARRAQADCVVTFDADGQHRPEDVPRLLAALGAGSADAALGSRFLEDAAAVPPLRRLLLRGAVLFTRASTGLRVTDAHNGLRALTSRAAALLDLRQDRMAHASELLDQLRRHRLRVVEVPVKVRYTDYSRSKGQRGWQAARILLDYVVGRLLG